MKVSHVERGEYRLHDALPTFSNEWPHATDEWSTETNERRRRDHAAGVIVSGPSHGTLSSTVVPPPGVSRMLIAAAEPK